MIAWGGNVEKAAYYLDVRIKSLDGVDAD